MCPIRSGYTALHKLMHAAKRDFEEIVLNCIRSHVKIYLKFSPNCNFAEFSDFAVSTPLSMFARHL